MTAWVARLLALLIRGRRRARPGGAQLARVDGCRLRRVPRHEGVRGVREATQARRPHVGCPICPPEVLFCPTNQIIVRTRLTVCTDACRVTLMNNAANFVIDLGNNESVAVGVFPDQDGTFTALARTVSKTFKTEAGARRWLSRITGKKW